MGINLTAYINWVLATFVGAYFSSLIYDIKKNEQIDFSKYDIFGFATFADAWRISVVMKDFMKALPRSNKLAFVFNTYGYINGKTTKILSNFAKKKGYKVVAFHALHTPENYPPQIKIGHGSADAPNQLELQKYLDRVACVECSNLSNIINLLLVTYFMTTYSYTLK